MIDKFVFMMHPYLSTLENKQSAIVLIECNIYNKEAIYNKSIYFYSGNVYSQTSSSSSIVQYQ